MVCVPYHPVTTHVCPDENGIGKLHNCSHSLTFTALFSVGHGSGPSVALDQWDGALQWVWVGLGDRTLPHTPGAHQHSSKPWDGAWKLILVSLCCSFSFSLHKCLTDAHSCFQCSGFTFLCSPLTESERRARYTKYLLMEINTFLWWENNPLVTSFPFICMCPNISDKLGQRSHATGCETNNKLHRYRSAPGAPALTPPMTPGDSGRNHVLAAAVITFTAEVKWLNEGSEGHAPKYWDSNDSRGWNRFGEMGTCKLVLTRGIVGKLVDRDEFQQQKCSYKPVHRWYLAATCFLSATLSIGCETLCCHDGVLVSVCVEMRYILMIAVSQLNNTEPELVLELFSSILLKTRMKTKRFPRNCCVRSCIHNTCGLSL